MFRTTVGTETGFFASALGGYQTNMHFMLEASIVLLVSFGLIRIAGKKAVSEMTGLELITLLSIASVIGHAISGEGLWKTIVILTIFVGILMAIQYLGVKFNWVEKWFMGKATLVIQDGKILTNNLKKLRMTVDQLETRLREKGISSFSDVKSATIEMSGHLGYELMRHAQPVTIGELENILAKLHPMQPKKHAKHENLFDEVWYQEHHKEISQELD